MTQLIHRIIEAFLYPPGLTILLMVIALLAFKLKPRFARFTLLVAILSISIFSMPIVGKALRGNLEPLPPLTMEVLAQSQAKVIVVLGGARYFGALEYPDYPNVMLSPNSLMVANYAAYLHRKSGLPIMVTGGKPLDEAVSNAALMRQVLEREYGVVVAFEEAESKSTIQSANAVQSVLESRGIRDILLVGSVHHLLRATTAFEGVGLTVTPAPTLFNSVRSGAGVMDYLPHPDAVSWSFYSLHEYFGRWVALAKQQLDQVK